MAKKDLKRGIFITFEGVEGCGKSTHSRLAYRTLRRMGYDCLRTREPGGTKAGGRIRRLLLDPANKGIEDVTELFLFQASRSQIVREVIRPALKRKRIVICDRFYDATMAYQGYGSGLDRGVIKEMSMLATGGLRPDLTLILDIGTEKGLRRATRYEADRMEEKALSYHKRVRGGYRRIARDEPRRVKLVAAMEDKRDTQGLIRKEILSVIQRYSASG